MKTMNLWHVAAGWVLVSVFFLVPPRNMEKVLRGVAPPVFLVAVGIAVNRVRGGADESDHGGKSGE